MKLICMGSQQRLAREVIKHLSTATDKRDARGLSPACEDEIAISTPSDCGTPPYALFNAKDQY